MSVPRAVFLRDKQPFIRPLSSRERREQTTPRASWLVKWASAFVITIIAIGLILLLFLAFDCAFSALTWVKGK